MNFQNTFSFVIKSALVFILALDLSSMGVTASRAHMNIVAHRHRLGPSESPIRVRGAEQARAQPRGLKLSFVDGEGAGHQSSAISVNKFVSSGAQGKNGLWGVYEHVGRAFVFHPQTGACGFSDVDEDVVVMIPSSIWEEYMIDGPEVNSLCDRTVTITYKGARTLAIIVGVCTTCRPNDIALSAGALHHLNVPYVAGDEEADHPIIEGAGWAF